MNVNELYLQAIEKHKAKKYDATLKIIDKVKKRNPNFRDAYYLEAWIWHERKNVVKEYYSLEKILPLLRFSSANENNFATETLSKIICVCGRLALKDKLLEFFSLLVKMSADRMQVSKTAGDVIFYANGFENFSADDFRALYAEYKKILADIAPYPKKFYAHEKIRVGFLSTDFYAHAAVIWSWSLLTKLDKNLFDTYFYSSAEKQDNVTKYLSETFDGWRDISDLTDEAAAKLIRDDEIDILFDLNGHTSNNRLKIAAYRPASVQMSGIGYMNSTGLDCIDYFLSDIYCAGDENFFTEKIIKLPHSHICYEPPTKLEPAENPPCLKNNFVTFGSFNRFEKMTDSILIAWKKILDAVPNSRLILKHETFNTDDDKNFVGKRLKNFGFDLARIEMRPYSPDYLEQYKDVDIALDTFPYTGGVTTCEALFMGVPVVSLYGSRHGSRFGLSILKNVGLDELAVDSYDEYINRAVALANDWELLTILRKNLRGMMIKSPLMNSENYLREIQEAFIKILSDERNAVYGR